MTLNFPDSANTGDVFHDSTSGFSYKWNGTVWISTDPQRAANIKELDDISSGFNGSTTQFNLTVSSAAVEPVSDAQILISVGGVMQNPTNDYTVVGSTITFTTAPSAGLTFFGVFLGQALSLNTIADGTVSNSSLKAGTAGVGIQSGGVAIGVGITQINFIGVGNTVVSIGNTVNVSIASSTVGIDTTGTSFFNNITASGNLNVTGDLTYDEVTAVNQKISGVTTTTGLDVLGISSVKDLRSVGVTTLTSAGITNLTVSAGSTFTGAIDANGNVDVAGNTVLNGNVDLGNATSDTITATGRFDSDIVPSTDNARDLGASGLEFKDLYIDGTANIDSLAADTAAIGDLTSGRVTYAGSSGELQDSGNLTFDGTDLTAASAKISDLTNTRVTYAGASGALQDNAGLTFDGTTLAATRLAAPVAFTTSLTANQVNVTGVSTFTGAVDAQDIIKGYKYTAAPYSGTTTTLTVTVATKVDGEHRYYGSGSSLGYVIDGLQSPFLTLTPGNTYRFDQSDSSNSSHQIKFYLESDKTGLYEVGVTYNGTAGNSGAYTQIVVGDTTPTVLFYMCVNHGYMGNAAQTNSNILHSNYDAVIGRHLSVTGITTMTGAVSIAGGLSMPDHTSGTIGMGIFGSDSDMKIYHNGTNAIVDNDTGKLLLLSDDIWLKDKDDGDVHAKFIHDGAVEIYYDNDKKFETYSQGIKAYNHVRVQGGEGENAVLALYADEGDDAADLWIVAANTDGNLEIQQWNGSAWEDVIKATGGGAVEIYYDNTSQFKTTSTGVEVNGRIDGKTGNHLDLRALSSHSIQFRTANTLRMFLNSDGHLQPYVDSTYDLGLNGTRWRNVYADTIYGDGSNLTGVGSSLAIWQANPGVYSSDQEMDSSVVGLAYTYSNALTAGSGSITLRETNSSGTSVQTWSTSQVTIDGNKFTADALSADLKSNQLYHITIPAGFFTDPNGTNSVGVAYTFNTKEQIWNLYTWGRGSVPGSGGLGQNNQTDRSSPTQVPGGAWSAVSQGSNTGHWLASKNDGTLWSWGQNAWGQLGQTNKSYYSSPRQIPGTNWAIGVDQIAKGTFLSLAIKQDGTLWSWGRNEFGQVGQGNETNYSSPRQIPGTTWRSVWTSHYSSYATKTDGTLWAWGSNVRGKLGQNNQTNYSSPRQIPGTTWVDGMGGDTAVGCTKTDNTLWMWGDDDDGTLGLGQRDQHKSSPYQLPGTTWGHLAGGYRCFWASKTDGTMWAWGQNEDNQLGVGIPDNNKRSSPTQIGSATSWRFTRKDIAGGQRGGFAIKTDNTLWAWGRGLYGVLGLNSTSTQDEPGQVLGTGWRQVAKGRESSAGIQDTELT
tara:strand:- start:1597 stop:5589 length:3993 start_codon:yes stop_codon:yes gene_type:complete